MTQVASLSGSPDLASPAAASGSEPFGALTPLLAPRSIAVIGASDRPGNLGGVAVNYLRKFRFAGPIWPVNAGKPTVADLPCYASLGALPGTPDLAIVAVPADSVLDVVRECADAGIRAAVVWAGGFAEQGDEGKAHQRALETLCKERGIQLCGPNCIGIINTSIGLTASFTSMLREHDTLTAGHVSMVSQSGGIAVNTHSRAQQLGLGFRVTISCGNEAALGVADFMHVLAQDDGTRVIAVYTEGLSNPDAFIDALREARRRNKPVVVLKGGATAASSRAAMAHTGRLAGSDRTYEAIFREFGVIRVYSQEEMLDVCLQLASMRPDQLASGRRVLISTFGGGSGVICTDQCGREELEVPALSDDAQQRIAPLLTPLSSTLNPIDLTPGMMTNATHRANMPAAMNELAALDEVDAWLFMASGFGELAPELAEKYDTLRKTSSKPVCLTWQSMPQELPKLLASRGIYAFTEHGRAVRTLGHLVRHAENRRHRIRRVDTPATSFDWDRYVAQSSDPHVISENVVAAILEAANLPVARGRIAKSADEAARMAREVGYPVAIKGISAAITHRAAAGLVALNVDSDEAAKQTAQRFDERAAARGVTLDGVWVQHMFAGSQELLITALRDAEFGVMIGVGIGGGMTEIVDDVAFARAPLDADGAYDLIGTLRTVRRFPQWLPDAQRQQTADWIARFSQLVAGAPWSNFTFEVNPLKIGERGVAAVDGLLLID
ncbi:acetate--CoA ligase family protein [Paraburkholderia sp. ZP32-5]|uniref:acetate--CoA ligase family protein n=1 Tax=Paraburkholderia sp. ZP32-5 TaxID=2883245 RepID=UPI001F2CF6C7|nr:acetate--CoA ligase family protein [Paraburkholderia sp. ZP32-5]